MLSVQELRVERRQKKNIAPLNYKTGTSRIMRAKNLKTINQFLLEFVIFSNPVGTGLVWKDPWNFKVYVPQSFVNTQT